jgi:hypothetical protein
MITDYPTVTSLNPDLETVTKMAETELAASWFLWETEPTVASWSRYLAAETQLAVITGTLQ